VMTESGPPDVLVVRRVDDPVAGLDQVLIETTRSNVTFVDTQIRAGRPPNPAMSPKLPAIPGNGVGGTVVAVGPNVGEVWVGARVVATTGGTGGYAELVTVDAERLVSVPENLSLPDAVALLADGRTAIRLMQQAAPRPGETVLIEAAGGGVGSLLVQLAKKTGARVIAAARGERKLALARGLGADRTIDYTNESWMDQLLDERAGRGSVDVVFDGIGGEIGRAAFSLLRARGRHFAFGMASGSFTNISEAEAHERGVTVFRGAAVSVPEMTALTKTAVEQGAAAELRPVVGQTFPLELAADAHRTIERRETLGKTLLAVR
jgi:NADPH2:quinone reductase